MNHLYLYMEPFGSVKETSSPLLNVFEQQRLFELKLDFKTLTWSY